MGEGRYGVAQKLCQRPLSGAVGSHFRNETVNTEDHNIQLKLRRERRRKWDSV